MDAFSRTRTHVEATLNHPVPAQVWHGGDFEAVDERAFDRVVGVNLKGTFFAVQAAVPHMRDRGGAVVIIGSDQSLVGNCAEFKSSNQLQCERTRMFRRNFFGLASRTR